MSVNTPQQTPACWRKKQKQKMSDKVLTFESCDLKGRVNGVPDTEAEWDEQGGKPGLMRETAVDYVLFHRILTDFRKDLMAAVEEQYKVEPKTKPHDDGKKDAKGNVIQVLDEKPAAYLARVAAQLGEKIDIFQPLADKLSETYQFKDFITERARSARSTEPGKRDLATAEEIIKDIARLARNIAVLRQRKIDIADTPTATQLALAIRSLRAQLEDEQKALLK